MSRLGNVIISWLLLRRIILCGFLCKEILLRRFFFWLYKRILGLLLLVRMIWLLGRQMIFVIQGEVLLEFCFILKIFWMFIFILYCFFCFWIRLVDIVFIGVVFVLYGVYVIEIIIKWWKGFIYLLLLLLCNIYFFVLLVFEYRII